jgi:hypothetical protein
MVGEKFSTKLQHFPAGPQPVEMLVPDHSSAHVGLEAYVPKLRWEYVGELYRGLVAPAKQHHNRNVKHPREQTSLQTGPERSRNPYMLSRRRTGTYLSTDHEKLELLAISESLSKSIAV